MQVASREVLASNTSGIYPIISNSMALLDPDIAITYQGLNLELVVTFAQDDGDGRRIAVPAPAFVSSDVFADISVPGVASVLPSLKTVQKLELDSYSLRMSPDGDLWPQVLFCVSYCTQLRMQGQHNPVNLADFRIHDLLNHDWLIPTTSFRVFDLSGNVG